MKLLIGALAAAGLMATAGAAAAAGPNIIVNGDFSAGATGFTSDYRLVSNSSYNQQGTNGEGTYSVGLNPNASNSNWVSLNGTQNNNEGNILIVNGATNGNPIVFQSSPAALTVSTYNFSADVIDICCNATFYSNGNSDNPSSVAFSYSITGPNGTYIPLTTVTTAGSQASAGTVYRATGTIFTATPPSTLYLQVTNGDKALSGNDFALDNISVTAAVPEPATWAFMIMGVAGAGLMLRRRQELTSGAFAA